MPWEASNDEAILNEARWEIARSVAWGLGEEPPARERRRRRSSTICRPRRRRSTTRSRAAARSRWRRSGSGLRAYGSDLNPVAVLIGKALVEIPPKFAGLPPVNPKSRARSWHGGGAGTGRGAQGLAEDVRYYGQWMRDEAERRIGHLYPEGDAAGRLEATVIAWLWARTVRSPGPGSEGRDGAAGFVVHALDQGGQEGVGRAGDRSGGAGRLAVRGADGRAARRRMRSGSNKGTKPAAAALRLHSDRRANAGELRSNAEGKRWSYGRAPDGHRRRRASERAFICRPPTSTTSIAAAGRACIGSPSGDCQTIRAISEQRRNYGLQNVRVASSPHASSSR